jgi:prepilin-type N-terminal cleavage/methylation domain-containing protein
MTPAPGRSEDGFTLMELIVSMAIGSIVLIALFTFVDVGVRANARIEDRADSSQRGRLAMEEMVRQLRSNLCQSTGNGPVLGGDDTSVTFYGQLLDTTGTVAPKKYRYSYDAATKRLLEDTWTMSAGSTWPSNVTGWDGPTTRTLATNLVPATGRPVFSFYAYKADGTIDPYGNPPGTPGDPPLTTTPLDTNKVSMVRIAFVAGPGHTKPTGASAKSAFDETVQMRLIDPNAPQMGAVCRL